MASPFLGMAAFSALAAPVGWGARLPRSWLPRRRRSATPEDERNKEDLRRIEAAAAKQERRRQKRLKDNGGTR